MRLNPDCVRDILLAVEENTDFNSYFMFYNNNSLDDENHENYEILSKYATNEVLYHIRQCELSGFVINTQWYRGDSCSIKDLSPQGHKFLADIRSDTVWNSTKTIANKIGSTSLDVLVKVSTGVLTQMINKHLGY